VLRFVLLLIGWLLPVGASAGPATIHVDAVNGSDLGDGSPESPLATLAAAHALAMPGDLVLAAPGVYAEDLAMADDVDVVGSGAPASQLAGAVTCAAARLAGFEIQGDVSCGSSARLERNRIRGTVTVAADAVELLGNLFLEPLPGALIDPNGAVHVTAGLGVVVAGNTFFGSYGVKLASDTEALLANNALVHGLRGIERASGAMAVVRHNDVFGNQFGIIGFPSNYIPPESDPTGTDGNVSLAPGFVDAEGLDFRLRPESPLVDAGDDAAPAADADLDGGARVLDGDGNASEVVDIGAEEHDPAEVLPLDFALDLLPRKFPNEIKLKKLASEKASRRKLKVAVLSDPGFDAPAETDLATLRLGAEPSLRCKTKDIDKDGLDDLFCQFPLSGVSLGDWPISVPPACVRGETLGGRALLGCDQVTIVP
jgi:hypothetical protein